MGRRRNIGDDETFLIFLSVHNVSPPKRKKRNEIEGGNDGPRRERVNLH